MTQSATVSTQPVVENRYIVGGKYSNNHVLHFLSMLRSGSAKLADYPQKKSLIRILKESGFSIDGGEDEFLTEMINHSNGVHAYLKGFRRINVKIMAPEMTPGMDPDYLKGLVGKIERAGFKVTEVKDAKMINLSHAYDWDKRRYLLVGYGHR